MKVREDLVFVKVLGRLVKLLNQVLAFDYSVLPTDLFYRE